MLHSDSPLHFSLTLLSSSVRLERELFSVYISVSYLCFNYSDPLLVFLLSASNSSSNSLFFLTAFTLCFWTYSSKLFTSAYFYSTSSLFAISCSYLFDSDPHFSSFSWRRSITYVKDLTSFVCYWNFSSASSLCISSCSISLWHSDSLSSKSFVCLCF